MTFPLSAIAFLALAAWCSHRLHRRAHVRGTVPIGLAMIAAYVTMVCSRTLGVGSGTVVFLLLDVAILVIGVQGALYLLEAFDPPDADDDEDGGSRRPDDGPSPGDGGGLAVDWTGFDAERDEWAGERATPAAPR